MHRLDLDQALAVVSGFGYIVVLPPNAEQAAQEVIGIVCVKAGDHDVVGSYAFFQGEERDFANLQRFKRILKRRTVQYDDGTSGEVKWLAV